MKRTDSTRRDQSLPAPPLRPDDSHKGTYGSVLIVAGSRGMSGAACLAGLGALRGGAGLVTVAVPKGILPVVAAVEPSYLTVGLPEDEDGRLVHAARDVLDRALERTTALAVGPGINQSASLSSLIGWLFGRANCPGVFDADALNLLAASTTALAARKRERVELPPRILTPHPGEFARLTGTDAKTVQRNRESLAVRFAREHRLVLVLKGHGSIVTDGQRVAVNATGNSGMATGGCGDVLTGLIGALLAQGMKPFDAARLGVHLHGMAGDLAAKEISKPGLVASDLPRWLGAAWLKFEGSSRRRR